MRLYLSTSLVGFCALLSPTAQAQASSAQDMDARARAAAATSRAKSSDSDAITTNYLTPGLANQPVSTVPGPFAGTWKGTVVNAGQHASFPVEVTFQTGATTARAVYPRERCTGTLTLKSGTQSNLTMDLAIPAPCTSGTVQIKRMPDGTLQYAWSRPGTKLAYSGKLSRG